MGYLGFGQSTLDSFQGFIGVVRCVIARSDSLLPRQQGLLQARFGNGLRPLFFQAQNQPMRKGRTIGDW